MDCTNNVNSIKNNKIFIIQQYLSNNDNKYFNIIKGIINKYNIEHSINVNGIFLNISTLDNIILDEIYSEFIKHNKDKNHSKINKDENIIENKIGIKKDNNYEKDNITLVKFDKYLLQKSRINISI